MRLLLTFAAAAWLAGAAAAEPTVRIILQDGSTVTGRLLDMHGGKTLIATPGGAEEMDLARVRRIEFGAPRLTPKRAREADALIEQLAAMQPLECLRFVQDAAKNNRNTPLWLARSRIERLIEASPSPTPERMRSLLIAHACVTAALPAGRGSAAMRLQRFRDYLKQNPADAEAQALSREIMRLLSQNLPPPRYQRQER